LDKIQISSLKIVNLTRPHKQVGVAVIWNQSQQILIDRRKAGGSMGGMWEFPGGKLEAGETAVECIIREIREELAIEITVGAHLISIDYAYPTFDITLIVHRCQYLSGIPRPIESDEMLWVDTSSLDQYQFPAANQAIVQAIQSFEPISAI
jgi:8-oxo-dGTP diphosphatase